jgi:hypothetical protein
MVPDMATRHSVSRHTAKGGVHGEEYEVRNTISVK